MKKFFLFVLFILIHPNIIFASEVIYSDYSNFGEYTEEYIESNELIDVKQEKRYLWYKQENVVGDYEPYDGSDSFILDDCYDTEYSDWTNYYEEKIGRIYEKRTVYNYELSKPIRYIHLTDLYGSYDAFRMPELIVKINGEVINYAYTCIGCQDGFSKYINNGIYAENESYINNGGTLIIDLRKEYPAHKVEVIFYIFDMGADDKKYTISYSLDRTNIYASKEFTYKFNDLYWRESRMFSHNIKDLGFDKNLWTYNRTYYEPLESEYIINENLYDEYRYKDTYCKTYTINKIYSPIYTLEQYEDFNIKDETKEKVFYSYRTRDKLEIKDNLYITSYNYKLDDFVIYSSSDYEIITDLDINKNGVYNITFKTNNIEVNKLLQVDIKENQIKEYEDLINRLNNEINNLNNTINNLKIEYEKIIEEKNKEINELNDNLKQCEENCNEQLGCLNNKILEKEKIIEEYKNKNITLKEQINNLQNEIIKLKVDLENNNNIIKKLNNDILSLITNLNDLEKQYIYEQEENKKLKIELNNLKQENEEYKNMVENLEQINNEYKDKIIELEKTIHKLENELDLIEKENIDKKQEIEKYIELIDKYKENINILNNEVETNINYIEEIKKSSKDKMNELDNKLKEANIKKEKYLQQINELEKYIKDLNDEIINLKTENTKIKKLEDLNDEYLDRIKELELNIKNTNLSITDTIEVKNAIIKKYEEEIKKIENEKSSIVEKLNNEIEKETKEKDLLNEKLNNYMLKINDSKISSFWIYIFIIMLLLLFLKKKSIKK